MEKEQLYNVAAVAVAFSLANSTGTWLESGSQPVCLSLSLLLLPLLLLLLRPIVEIIKVATCNFSSDGGTTVGGELL